MPAAATDHDALYHRLFSDPDIVAQLLTDFVGGPWLDGLALGRMERLSTKFHAGTGQRREGDMIWRIPRDEGDDAYLVLLLEFQSTPNTFMALRVATYACLLWQQLVTEQRLPKDGKLPPLLPVVLYNGSARWRSAVAVRDLVGLPQGSPLWRWQPDLRYHLIDVGGLVGPGLETLDSLAALWFRLEKAADPPSALAIASAVMDWFSRHSGYVAARAVFADMLGALLAPLGPEHRMPQNLEGTRDMSIFERVEQWREEWKQEGLAAGLEEGRRAGEATMLLRQLQRRFAPLPSWAEQRVLGAETVDLEEWGLRILEAATLDDVFHQDGA